MVTLTSDGHMQAPSVSCIKKKYFLRIGPALNEQCHITFKGNHKQLNKR